MRVVQRMLAVSWPELERGIFSYEVRKQVAEGSMMLVSNRAWAKLQLWGSTRSGRPGRRETRNE